jgi:hypothetical protein
MKNKIILFALAVILPASAYGLANVSQEVNRTDIAPSEIFKQYEDAFNRHDPDAVSSFWPMEETKAKIVLPIWKGYREFEAVTHAIFDISWKSLGGDAFEVTQREDCDFYRDLGTGTKISIFVVHLREGKFHDVQRGTNTDTGGSYDQALNQFKDWILKTHPEVAPTVLKDDDFVFNQKSADTIMRLVREWRKREPLNN